MSREISPVPFLFFACFNNIFMIYSYFLKFIRLKLIRGYNKVMAKVCEICGKKPQIGNLVSHANNKTKTRWLPNLQKVKVVYNNTVKKMRVCTRCLRTGKVRKAV